MHMTMKSGWIRACLSSASSLLSVLALSSPHVLAGNLTIAWSPSVDHHAAGYRIYIGSEPGLYTRVVDAGGDVKTTIRDLADERTHFLVVREYDARGTETGAVSTELASLPAPRIVSVEPDFVRTGAEALVAIEGSNIDPAALVRARDPRLIVRGATNAGPGRVIVTVRAVASGEGEIGIDATSLTVINPGRKAEEFFRFHPEALDADGDQRVDQADVRLVQEAFGSSQGGTSYSLAADLDGDGVVDGRDLSRILAKAAAAAPAKGSLAQ